MITRAFGMKLPGQIKSYTSMVQTNYDSDFGLFIQQKPRISEDYSTSPVTRIWMGPNEQPANFYGVEGYIIVAGIVTQSNYPEQGEVPGMPLSGDRGEVHFWSYREEGPGLCGIEFFTFLSNCFKTNWAINSTAFGSIQPTINVSATPTVAEYTNLLGTMRKFGMWTNHPYWKLFSGDTTDYVINHIRNPNYSGTQFWLSSYIYDVMMPAP